MGPGWESHKALQHTLFTYYQREARPAYIEVLPARSAFRAYLGTTRSERGRRILRNYPRGAWPGHIEVLPARRVAGAY